MVKDGLRRSNFRVKNLDVSGQVTGNIANPVMVSGEGDVWYVDASKATGASGDGTTWNEAFITIAEGIAAASAGDICYVAQQTHTDYTGDPVSYSENMTIPYATSNFALIGVSRGRTQGGLPQCKVGSTTTQALLRIRAPGCLIMNLGFNGSGATGGGILLDDDYAAKSAFGTTIVNCHFKNCNGPDVDDAKEGGAIQWTAAGNAWQTSILGCRFYKNAGGIVLLGTSSTRPQDILIEDCDFTGMAANVDCDIWGTGTGSGFGSIHVNRCTFGQLPELGSNVNLYYDFTGSLNGSISNCTFGAYTNNSAASTITFGTGGSGGKTPATMNIAGCFGASSTLGESGEICQA